MMTAMDDECIRPGEESDVVGYFMYKFASQVGSIILLFCSYSASSITLTGSLLEWKATQRMLLGTMTCPTMNSFR